ncbi:MAG TPA: TIGR03032 family protein [Solirubrobacterales bacterium]|nr:TIGR03032 family protein [Solirubrobacterales bacterium]
MSVRVHSPVFLVGPPASGTDLLFDALTRAEGLMFPKPTKQPFTDALADLEPVAPGRDSHRLIAADATAEVADALLEEIASSVADREGREPEREGPAIRLLDRTPRNSLRVPFLDALFPDAIFAYIHRDPRESLPEVLSAWQSGRFVTNAKLPGWPGPAWTLPLVPGWRDLAGRDLPEIVAAQWSTVAAVLLDDLEALPPERWCVTDHALLLDDPRPELERLCAFLGLSYDQALLTPFELARHGRAVASEQKRAKPQPEVEAVFGRTEAAAARARDLLGETGARRRRAAATAKGESPLRSVHTGSFPALLERTGGSLLVSTYQTGKLVCARTGGDGLNTHFRDFEKPMGLAVANGRFALGTRSEIWDFRDMPEVAKKIDPPGSHDACYVPRNRHVTGDISIHEIGFGRDGLWIVATAFSCLATLDADHSFVPRWTPPFVSELAAGDRCHLNGMAIVDGVPSFVSALGATDEPGGWRENKATGGVIIDVASGETVLSGLCMPHSPRVVDGRLVFLQSGKGELCRADLATGEVETVAELPGFTRGLEIVGPLAFVGLSQIRETSTFGNLPLVERVDERLCGVWAVDLESGRIVGFLRFEDLVQEIFDVALLPAVRFPEVAEMGSSAVTRSFSLP